MGPVKAATLRIGLARQEVQARFWTPVHASVVDDLQFWLDQYPTLRLGETFCIGMWPAKIMLTDRGWCLGEYDFVAGDYVAQLERSILLWIEQDAVCRSRDLPWNSIGPDQLLWLTPSVPRSVGRDLMEGVRDRIGISEASQSSGWLIYTNADRDNGLGWEPMRMVDALTQLDMHVLRFLGVPDGWTFQITKDGQTYLWSEGLVESH